jgi:hypothetical protein
MTQSLSLMIVLYVFIGTIGMQRGFLALEPITGGSISMQVMDPWEISPADYGRFIIHFSLLRLGVCSFSTPACSHRCPLRFVARTRLSQYFLLTPNMFAFLLTPNIIFAFLLTPNIMFAFVLSFLLPFLLSHFAPAPVQAKRPPRIRSLLRTCGSGIVPETHALSCLT